MPLRFDPASILAPGGIASGVDDIGAAVIRALDRRAERRYATERAAAASAAEENKFARQLAADEARQTRQIGAERDLFSARTQAEKDLQAARDAAEMERLKVGETGKLGRALSGEAGNTVRNLTSNATRILTTGMNVAGRLFKGDTSTSVDGKNALKEQADLDRILLDARTNAARSFPFPKEANPLEAQMFGLDPAQAIKIRQQVEQQRQAHVQQVLREAGVSIDPQTGRAVRLPRVPVTGQGVPPDVGQPAAAAAVAKPSVAARYRAKFPNSPAAKLDDAKLEQMLAAKNWTGE